MSCEQDEECTAKGLKAAPIVVWITDAPGMSKSTLVKSITIDINHEMSLQQQQRACSMWCVDAGDRCMKHIGSPRDRESVAGTEGRRASRRVCFALGERAGA